MKKGNCLEVLAFVLRLIARFVVGTAIGLIMLYVFFKDTDLFDFLLSSKTPVIVFLFFGVTYFFGVIEGLVLFAIEFVIAISKKDMEIKKAQEEIDSLNKTLNRISKKHASSLADRMFEEISHIYCNDPAQPKGNTTLGFKTLQESLKEDPQSPAKN